LEDEGNEFCYQLTHPQRHPDDFNPGEEPREGHATNLSIWGCGRSNDYGNSNESSEGCDIDHIPRYDREIEHSLIETAQASDCTVLRIFDRAARLLINNLATAMAKAM
jgi:hypothetical protein